jgi:hypothetical protein
MKHNDIKMYRDFYRTRTGKLTDKIRCKKWVYYDENQDRMKLHRLDGPAEIQFWDDGHIYAAKWYLFGVLHREDGPAFISYYDNGTDLTNSWYLAGDNTTESEIKKAFEIVETLKTGQDRNLAILYSKHKLLYVRSAAKVVLSYEN